MIEVRSAIDERVWLGLPRRVRAFWESSILFSSENTLLCRICAQVFVGGEVAVAE